MSKRERGRKEIIETGRSKRWIVKMKIELGYKDGRLEEIGK